MWDRFCSYRMSGGVALVRLSPQPVEHRGTASKSLTYLSAVSVDKLSLNSRALVFFPASKMF